MSGIIHMETELVRGGGQKITYTAADYIEMADQLRRSAGSLGVDWLGPSATDYVHDLERLADSIRTQSLRLDELGNRLLREVDEWVNADQIGSSSNAAFPSDGLRVELNLPKSVSSKPPFYLGFGIMIIDGIHYSLGVARDQWNRVLDAGGDLAKQAIAKSDQTIDDALGGYLGNPKPGNSESVKLQLKGDVSIPGAEVGVPGTFKLAGAKEAELTKKNGKYYFKLSQEAGAGIEEPLYKAGLGLKIGDKTIGGKVEASAEALAKIQTEVEYEFDPRKAGDMTKMAAFMYGVGVADSVAGPLASPPLIAMKDNLHSIKVGAGVEGKAQANVDALVRLAGVEGKVGGMQGGELRRTESGGWEVANQLEVDGQAKFNVITLEKGVKAAYRIESVTDLTSRRESAKVIMEIQGEDGRAIKLSEIDKYLPKMDDVSKIGLKGGSSESSGYKLEYRLDAPAGTALEMLKNPEQGLQTLKQNSKIEVYSTHEIESGLGANAEVGAVSQAIGLDVEANGVRSSERRIYPLN